MTDDLGDRFRQAADDGDRPLPVTPPELLARARRQRRRRRDLMAAGGTSAVAALTVGALVFGGTVLRTGGEADDSTPPADDERQAKTVPLDHGPLPEGELRHSVRRACSAGGAARPGTVEAARLLDGPLGLTPVMLVGNDGSGESRVCTDAGFAFVQGGVPARPTPDDPIKRVPTYGKVGKALRRIGGSGYWSAGGVYAVADTVDRIEVRVGSDRRSEPWRVATPHSGYVFWATWFNPDDYAEGERLRVQWRAFDTDGNRIDPGLLPHRSRRITAPGPIRPDYERIRDRVFEVASEHLDPDGEHLSGYPARFGHTVRGWWVSVEPRFAWRTHGQPGVGAVEVELTNRPMELTYIRLAECGPRNADCERRDLGADGTAWVIDPGDGTVRVNHKQPDGEGVSVLISREFDRVDAEPIGEMDIAVEDIVDLVTDDRLNLPNRPTKPKEPPEPPADPGQVCLREVERVAQRSGEGRPEGAELEVELVHETDEATTVVVSDGADYVRVCNVHPDTAVSYIAGEYGRGARGDDLTEAQSTFSYAANFAGDYDAGPGELVWAGGRLPEGVDSVTYVFANGTELEAVVEDGYWAMHEITTDIDPFRRPVTVVLDGPAAERTIRLRQLGCNQVSHGC